MELMENSISFELQEEREHETLKSMSFRVDLLGAAGVVKLGGEISSKASFSVLGVRGVPN